MGEKKRRGGARRRRVRVGLVLVEMPDEHELIFIREKVRSCLRPLPGVPAVLQRPLQHLLVPALVPSGI